MMKLLILFSFSSDTDRLLMNSGKLHHHEYLEDFNNLERLLSLTFSALRDDCFYMTTDKWRRQQTLLLFVDY